VLGLCVQPSVMSDNYQSTTSECAKPTCNRPFDSIQRTDSHSTHATSTISLWGLDVVEFPPCVWTVTVLNREQMQNGKFMMDIISALMQQSWRSSRRVNRVLDELSLVRYVTARTERRDFSTDTELFALCK
jgi:hypothetical protein